MGATLSESFNQSVAVSSAKTAIICGEARLSYETVASRVNKLAGALRRLGLRAGDRIAILAFNCHRYLELYYAAPLMGAVVVPLNFRLSPRELKYIIDHSRAKAIVVDDSCAPMFDEIKDALPDVAHSVLISGQPRSGYLAYEELLEAETGKDDFATGSENDLTGLFYTSGTTGEPKGVMLTHRNILSNVEHSQAVHRPACDEVYLHVAPMFHLADAAAVFSITVTGSTHVFIPRFEPKAVLEVMEREHVTSLLLVPTMINFMLRQPDIDRYDLSSLRQITYGASPIAPELLRKAMKVFKCRFFQGYGLTEAAPLLTALMPEDHAPDSEGKSRRLSSCGKPVPGVEVRVVKDDGLQVAPGEAGEIIARGPNIMAGYWQRPEDTAAAIREGWLHTGDLATVDEEGYIYLVDRKKDMIVSGGENVFSTEVEAVLYEHAAVKEAAVIPIPHPDWGEAVHACVVLVEGESLTAEELIEVCRGRLAGHKLPHSIAFFLGELPKGGSGKILKKELREPYWRGRSRAIG
jgi:long-chain acyl-CoA synthetase